MLVDPDIPNGSHRSVLLHWWNEPCKWLPAKSHSGTNDTTRWSYLHCQHIRDRGGYVCHFNRSRSSRISPSPTLPQQWSPEAKSLSIREANNTEVPRRKSYSSTRSADRRSGRKKKASFLRHTTPSNKGIESSSNMYKSQRNRISTMLMSSNLALCLIEHLC